MRTTSTKLVRAVSAVVVCVATLPAVITAETNDAAHWSGTGAEKTWGLMQVWGTVKYNFAFFERLPGLDWDAVVRGAIPRVLDAPDQEEYYRRLNELTALLHHGHTLVVSPSLREGAYDNPPLEFQLIEDRIILARTGDTEEIRAQGIRPGMELPSWGSFSRTRGLCRSLSPAEGRSRPWDATGTSGPPCSSSSAPRPPSPTPKTPFARG